MKLITYIGVIFASMGIIWSVYYMPQREIVATFVAIQSWVLIMTMKHADYLEERIEKLKTEIKEVTEFKYTHKQCTQNACMDKVLDDIIGDM
jgi:hypothetical protein